MGQRRDNPRTKKIPARSWLQQLPIHSDFIEEYRLLVEKEVATHSSMLAWIMPWTKEPGGLQYMGSHRAGHDSSSLAHRRYT